MKRYLFILLAIILAVGLAGCAGSQQSGGQTGTPVKDDPAQTAAKTDNAKKTKYPFTIKDATGEEFTFTKAPERIVSTSPSETEILFALGLADKIVGVSNYDDYPEEAKSKPKVGGVVKPNEEAIIAVNPDLVVGGISMKEQVAEKLRELKLNVFKLEPKKLDDVFNNILLLGQITDKQQEAEKVVAQMKAERQKVVDAVKSLKPEQKKKVYIEFSPGWTVGKGEFMDELITLTGGVNVASDLTGWSKINEEKVIKDNPDVILYAKGVTDQKTGATLEQMIKGRSGWEKITAIQTNRIAGLEQNIISRPGPRLTKGLLEMAKAIYPELVK